MPKDPTMLAASVGRVSEITGRSGSRVADAELFGNQTAERDRDARLDLAAGPGEPLLRVAVGEQAERCARLMIDSTSSRRFWPTK